MASNRLSLGEKIATILEDVSHGSDSGQILTMKIFYHTASVIGGFTISVINITEGVSVERFSLNTTHRSYNWDWNEISICLPPKRFSLSFTVIHGDKGTSDLAIDDLQLTGMQCDYTESISGMGMLNIIISRLRPKGPKCDLYAFA